MRASAGTGPRARAGARVPEALSWLKMMDSLETMASWALKFPARKIVNFKGYDQDVLSKSGLLGFLTPRLWWFDDIMISWYDFWVPTSPPGWFSWLRMTNSFKTMASWALKFPARKIINFKGYDQDVLSGNVFFWFQETMMSCWYDIMTNFLVSWNHDAMVVSYHGTMAGWLSIK